MIAIEFGIDGDPSKPAADAVNRICAEALARGLVVLSCGIYANAIRILVPITASDAIVDEGMQILSDAIDAVLG
jgi:4-aminobutyrate aminotransferase/(S)-3-amino-2-methylpropionate transaminase